MQIGARLNVPEVPGYFDGWLDEFRISRGVRWDRKFAVPSRSYESGGVPRLYFRDLEGNEFRVTASGLKTKA